MNDVNGHFIRQRRNIIITSIVILFYVISGAKAESVSTPGIGIALKIANPEVIIWFMATFFFYFLWRYHTACMACKGIEIYQDVMKREAYDRCYAKTKEKLLRMKKITDPKEVGIISTSHSNPSYLFKRISMNLQSENKEKDKTVAKLSSLVFFITCTKSIFNTAKNSVAFSEYVMPYAIAFIAYTALCIRLFHELILVVFT